MTSSFDDLVRRDRAHIWHPYTQEKTAPDPLPVVTAEGATLHLADGRTILDLISSWWVVTHGHAHPAIARAIAEQAARLEQVIFAGFTHPPAVALASALVKHLPEGLTRVFYSDNGSTSVEVALKLALQYWRNRGEERDRFLAFEGGYHGDTVGAMSAGRESGFFAAFGPLLFPVEFLPYPATWIGDEDVEAREVAALDALERDLDVHGHRTAAVIVEPLVQGAAGMRMCRPAFLRALAERLARAGVLLIFDEVMTGFGRTGTLFAHQKAGVTPDLICLSKGLTGGFLPLAVTACREPVYEAFLDDTFDRAFAHGHSFTANPLGCAAALAAFSLFEEERTLDRIAAIESLHRERLADLAALPRVTSPRVTGSIAALDVVTEDAGYTASVGPRLKAFFLDRGLLIRPLGNVVYLLPPYCTRDDDLHRAWDAIAEAVKNAV